MPATEKETIRMSGFFSDDRVKNPQADEPWMKSERDGVLDTYLSGGAGATPKLIAQKIGRNPKAVRRLIEQFTNNERDRVLRYEPFRRISRKGKKFTQNEFAMWKAHVAKEVPAEATAKLFMRGVEELSLKKGLEVNQAKAKTSSFAPTLDLIWAHRYIYFVYKTPIISDQAYDDLVKEEIEFGGGGDAFEKIKNFRGWPVHITTLALYLTDKPKWKAPW